MTKEIEIYKHPYKWNVKVEFGTLEEMLKNSLNKCASSEIYIGGSFNMRMQKDSGRRAPLIQIGVYICPDCYAMYDPKRITDVSGICSSPWEGVFWHEDFFNEEIKQGLYPVKADWDGKTYIERGHLDENRRFVSHYELTDTWYYL